MKLNFDMKKKNVNVDVDVEKLVEKGIDNHESNWKEKFHIKHSAKKELMEIKHQQKIELESANKNKKNWIQKIQEEKRKTKELELNELRRIKELELEEKKRQEENEKKNLIFTIVISLVIGIVSIGFFIAGIIADPGFNVVGIMLFIVIGYIWIFRGIPEKENKREEKKKNFRR